MRAASLAKLVVGFTFVISVRTAPAQIWFPDAYITNTMAITNGRAVVTALLAGDALSKSNAHALIGSVVVFSGWGVAYNPTNVTLDIGSNIVVKVELPAPKESRRQVTIGGLTLILPPRDQFEPGCNGWRAWAVGALQSVDFENRVIYVRSRLRDVEAWGK